jgi:hypothetical protein
MPHGSGPRDPAAREAGLRLRVWAGSLRLDTRLAEGVAPTNSPELALRARQLADDRSRRALASALTGAVKAARLPDGPWSRTTAIAAPAVRDAANLCGRSPVI